MPPYIIIKGTPNLQTFENGREIVIQIKKFSPKNFPPRGLTKSKKVLYMF